jgi:hypothetical protein
MTDPGASDSGLDQACARNLAFRTGRYARTSGVARKATSGCKRNSLDSHRFNPLIASVWDLLTQFAGEPIELVDRCLRGRMAVSLTQALPELLVAMVERHELVSERKGRQRWLFVDGNVFVRDDPRPMGLGFHALRFPQFGSLARDLRLREEDLRDG